MDIEVGVSYFASHNGQEAVAYLPPISAQFNGKYNNIRESNDYRMR